VEVIDGCPDGLLGFEIAVVPGPFLPKPKRAYSWPLLNRKFLYEWVSNFNQPLLNSIRAGPFDREQQRAYFRRLAQRKPQQVDVFRHEDEDRQTPLVVPEGSIDGFGKQVGPLILQ
jgi:hypothetical protein